MNPAFNNGVLAFSFPGAKLYMLIPSLYWSRPRPVLEQFLRLLCWSFKCRGSLALAKSQSCCACTGLLAGQPQQDAGPCCWMKISIPVTASDFHSLMITILLAISLYTRSVCTAGSKLLPVFLLVCLF